MDLSTISDYFRIECQRCGRLFDFYSAGIGVDMHGVESFVFGPRGKEGKDWKRGPGRLQPRGGRVTGRHHPRRVTGRDGEPALRFECGVMTAPGTISYADLRRKIERATEYRIAV